MIKINLLQNRVKDGAGAGAGAGKTSLFGGLGRGGGGGGGGGSSSAGLESGQLKEVLVKLAAILIFTVGLMMWENQTIRALNSEQQAIQQRASQLQADLAAKNAEVEKVKDVEAQAKELEDKLKILKLLSKLRLREVKTLDFMQSSIPEKVWLKGVNYESDKVHVENGHFQIQGHAVATEELTEFVKRLDGSAYLMDVIVVKNQEVPVNKNTTIRDFLFTAEVENKN